jgi:hypothetical protein
MPGIAATVSKTIARFPYLLAKNVSAKKRKNLTNPYAKPSEIELTGL